MRFVFFLMTFLWHGSVRLILKMQDVFAIENPINVIYHISQPDVYSLENESQKSV